jgi:SulP family sulfate permease
MGLLVIVFPRVVAYVAMPPLGMLLILASLSTIKPSNALSIWHTGWPSRLASVTTFFCTLLLPIQAAVGIGVVLSALLYINESSTDVSVVELVKREDGSIEEHTAPSRLESDKATVLDVYGHLFYAGARTLELLLPDPSGARNPVVILRLRGRTNLGATLVHVLGSYARTLQVANGRLYLTGISEGAYAQLVRSGKIRLTGPVRVYEATAVRGESTHEAHADAQTWLVNQKVDT